jgi:hypothetical protein
MIRSRVTSEGRVIANSPIFKLPFEFGIDFCQAECNWGACGKKAPFAVFMRAGGDNKKPTEESP